MRRRSISVGTVAVAAAILFTAGAARAGGNACLAGDCHKAFGAPKGVHSIIRDSGCGDCHAGEVKPGGSQMPDGKPVKPPHALKLTAKGDELCMQCHTKFEGAHRHDALKEGCLTCHDPHVAAREHLVKEPQEKLCADCHDAIVGKPGAHQPVKDGRCTACHTPHAGPNPRLLKKTGRDLCLGCHAKDVDLKAAHLHSPVKDGECLKCHKPHHSPEKGLLAKPADQLCGGCHAVLKKPFIHAPLKLGRCAGCHEPHAGPHKKLLRDERQDRMCFRCHADDLTGRKVVHPALKDGKCLDCHLAHGADQPKALKMNATKLCEECHGRKDEEPVVHAVLKRGGCIACHDPHATANKAMLIAPINELCAACHAKQKDGAHVFTGFNAAPHPVDKKPDPARKGEALSCISCHNPHSSKQKKLYYEGEGKLEMCKRCHKK